MDYLSVVEAARRLAVVPETLRNWRRAGVGPRPEIIAGRNVYPEAEVAAWVGRMPLRPGRRPKARDEAPREVAP